MFSLAKHRCMSAVVRLAISIYLGLGVKQNKRKQKKKTDVFARKHRCLSAVVRPAIKHRCGIGVSAMKHRWFLKKLQTSITLATSVGFARSSNFRKAGDETDADTARGSIPGLPKNQNFKKTSFSASKIQFKFSFDGRH